MSYRLIHVIFFLYACLTGSSIRAADSELTNYKTGISLNFGNSMSTATDKGAGYMEEYFYFDKVIDDRKVVYIKSTTPISMSHNDRNVAGAASGAMAYEGVDTTVGIIRFKVDGDQWRGPWATTWTSYTVPLLFSNLTYDLYGSSDTHVVGATGATGGELTSANRSSRYFRGMQDTAHDEWHILTVADDDSAYAKNQEWMCSDGKIWYFVVNPKTPCATWRVTGNGQFYTTPPKKYFFPIIYDQTTYISGTVTCELRDINGNNVFYRINGGSFANAGSSSVTLNQDVFNAGVNTLEYYYAGNASNIKTRAVIKNPGYPSAGEDHGDKLWVNASYWDSEVKPRFDADPEMKKWRDFWRTNSTWNAQSYITNGSRMGYRVVSDTAFVNAFTARWEGMSFKQYGFIHTAADLARLSLFEAKANLDPIGYESAYWSGTPLPSREMNYRGYYDCVGIYEAAGAYDILIGYYRSDQGYTDGITPIQDYFIRDVLGKWVHNAQLIVAGYAVGGMWPDAHVTAASMIAGVMPSYSTKYYGTCGLDGNSTTYGWTPFPDTSKNYSWRDLFLSENVPVTGYPDCERHASINDHFTSDGTWNDRAPYSNTNLFGKCVMQQYNIIKLFNPIAKYPNVDVAMRLAAQGLLYGNVYNSPGDYLPVFRSWAGLQNAWFPDFLSIARPQMLAKIWPDEECIGMQLQYGRPFVALYYNHNLPIGKIGSVQASIPSFTPPGATYAVAQTVTMSSASEGATIRYTTDGSTPTATTGKVYTAPVVVTTSITLKAIATGKGLMDSPIQTANYNIGSMVDTPMISPKGGKYMDNQSISITCITPGATIFYTTDGSDPISSSMIYTGSFVIRSNTVIRSFGMKAGYQSSGIVTENYQIGSVESVDSIWDGAAFASRSSSFVTSLDVKPGINSIVGLASGMATAFTELAAIVRFAPGGFVDARNGASYDARSVLAYTPGLTYRVVISVNLPARTYSAMVTAPDATPVPIATDFAFRTEQATINQLGYLATWTQLGTTTVNNFGLSPSTVTGLKLENP